MTNDYKQAKDNYRKKVGELATKTQFVADPIKGIIPLGTESWKQVLEPLSICIIKESMKIKQIDSTSHVNLKYWGLNGYDWEYAILKELLDQEVITKVYPIQINQNDSYDYWGVSNHSISVDYAFQF